LPDRAGVQITEDNGDPVDFAGRGVGIRVTYGAAAYPHQAVETLFHDRMLPVAAPPLAAALPEGAVQAADRLLIRTQWGPTYASPQSWAGWHVAMGSTRRPDSGKGLSVDRLVIAATAARMPQPYVMVARPAARQRTGVEPIWRHLLSARAPA